jgi:sugar phosphate isomerase/epimerase
MYSLSTCWNSHRHTDGRALLREIRDLGFEYAELSHGTRISLLPGILAAVDAGEIKISSLHNFCPLPMGVDRSAPNLFQFSAESQREREQALRYTRKTLEFATRVQAPLVVLHLGSVELKDYSSKLKDLAGRGERHSVSKAVRTRRPARAPEGPCVGGVNLREFLPEAETRGLKLGCENREAVRSTVRK